MCIYVYINKYIPTAYQLENIIKNEIMYTEINKNRRMVNPFLTALAGPLTKQERLLM